MEAEIKQPQARIIVGPRIEKTIRIKIKISNEGNCRERSGTWSQEYGIVLDFKVRLQNYLRNERPSTKKDMRNHKPLDL